MIRNNAQIYLQETQIKERIKDVGFAEDKREIDGIDDEILRLFEERIAVQ